MPFVPVANTALVETRMTWASQQVENTLWIEFPAAISPSDLLTLANDIDSWWETFYGPLVSDGVQLHEVVATDMTSASSGQVSVTPAIAAIGGQSSPDLPSNASLTISFRTALRGRSFRGRNYLVGLTEDTNTGNIINDAFLALVVAAYEELLPGGSALSAGEWVVASRFSGVDTNGVPIPRVAGVTTPITTVVIVDNVIDSQRRRLPGRGN